MMKGHKQQRTVLKEVLRLNPGVDRDFLSRSIKLAEDLAAIAPIAKPAPTIASPLERKRVIVTKAAQIV